MNVIISSTILNSAYAEKQTHSSLRNYIIVELFFQ